MSTNDWVGSIGVGMILLAYFASTFNFITNRSILFFVFNIVGAALACYASYLIDYWPFVILEGTWAFVSLLGLLKATR